MQREANQWAEARANVVNLSIADPTYRDKLNALSEAEDRLYYAALSSAEEKALEEIKYLALTAGAPDYTPTPDAMRRIIWLCRQAGVTKTLDQLGEYAQGRVAPPSPQQDYETRIRSALV